MPATAAAKSSPFPSQNVRSAIKLALSLALFYWWGLWTNQDLFRYGALAIVICSMGTRGATIGKGVARVVGTTFGVLVAYIILALFNHDRWATMLAFACHLALISYFMQGSRNSYAWYVAAFVPLVVWGDNFPHFDQSFNFGAYRWLETTVGALLYTVVDLVLWPRQAGDQLNQQGQSLWAAVHKLLASYRAELEQGVADEGTSQIRAQVAGARAGAMASLQDAFLDTPKVADQKRVWQAWQSDTAALLDSLALWHQSIGDARHLDLDRLLPQLNSALRTLEARIGRIGDRWRQRYTDDQPVDGDDHDLLQALDLEIARSAASELSHLERAALACFAEQWKTIDQTSREVLRCGRVLADLETDGATEGIVSTQAVLRPKPWLERRFVHALYPSVAFVLAFLFWVYWYPPTGPKVPMFAGILSLVALRSGMNPRRLANAFILSIFFAVSPVYWFVMPHLGTGSELLVLIFVYTFVFGWLGGYSPLLKMGPIFMFVMMSGISNEQTYSFNSMVDGALMILLGVGFAAVAYMFFNTLRPEATLLAWLERFFAGCARFTGESELQDVEHRDKRRASRRRILESMILPAPSNVLATLKQLDYNRYPDNQAEQMARLHDCVQGVAYRLQALETVIDRTASPLLDHHPSLAPLGGQLQEIAEDIFQRWASLGSDLPLEEHRSALERVSRNFRAQLDTLAASPRQERLGDRALAELYTVVGSVGGLIDAMTSTQSVMKQINWRQLALPRF